MGRAGHDDLHDRRGRRPFRGFISRIAAFLAPESSGTALSPLLDNTVGQINSVLGGATEATNEPDLYTTPSAAPRGSASRRRRSWAPTARRSSGGTPRASPSAAILLVLPAVIALIAENTGHVKAVAEMTGDDLDPVMGRAIAADGFGIQDAERRQQ